MTLNSGEKLKQKSTEERNMARKKAVRRAEEARECSSLYLNLDPLVLTNPSAIFLTEDHHRVH